MIPHVPFSPTSHTPGIYVVRLIGPSELKIAPTFREPGKVRQISGNFWAVRGHVASDGTRDGLKDLR